MRHFHWKTAIISVIIFTLPIFFYPVSGTMIDGVTTYSYGFPSKWLSLRYQNQGGRLFGFELFQAKNVNVDISFLTGILDLLIIYLILTAFVKVFWTNHFSIKFLNWRTRRYYAKHGITPPEEEVVVDYHNTITMECTAKASDDYEHPSNQDKKDHFDSNNKENRNPDKEGYYYQEDFQHDNEQDVDTDKTA